MAKTTRRDDKKPKEPTPIAVLDPPEPGENEDEPADAVPAEPETPPTVTEVADAKEISRRRGNAQYKKAPSVGFISRLSQFEKTEWETQLLLYIYRLAPITDRLATGNQVKYIARFTEPIDEETILKDKLWGGSGKYRLTLNRKDPETGKSSCIDQAEIEIEHPQYPPVVPVGEWVDDPRNKRWAWARQPGQTNGQPTTVTPTASAGPTVNDLVDGMIKLKTLEPSTDTSMQTFVMERLASAEDRSNKLIDRIITPPTPPPAPEKPAQDPMVAFMLDRLAKAEDRATMLLEKLITKENAPAKAEADPLSTIAIKLLEKRLEKMDEKPDAETAAERQSRMNGTQELISEITKSMAPVLDKAFSLFTLMAAQKQAPQQTQRPTATRTVEVAAQPAEQTQQSEPTQPATAQSQPQQQPTMEQMQQQVLNLVLGQATPTLKQYLRDSDGSSFAEIFCDMAFAIPNVPPPFNEIPGVQAHEFAKQFGRDAIVNAYKLNPSLYQQIAPNAEAEQAFVTFLDEFLAYDPNTEAEDES